MLQVAQKTQSIQPKAEPKAAEVHTSEEVKKLADIMESNYVKNDSDEQVVFINSNNGPNYCLGDIRKLLKSLTSKA
jgi:hypothetical protein